MKRRQVVFGGIIFIAGVVSGSVGTLLSGVLSGRSGAPESGQVTPTATQSPTPTAATETATPTETPTPTPTPTSTPTPTPTATPPPTATPTPALPGITHDLGERFTVGQGDSAITYRIIEFYRADKLGGRMNTITAEGTFLIVVLELTNRQDGFVALPEEFRVSSRELNIWTRFDHTASERIDDDDRITEQPIVNKTIRSGQSVTGAVAFDVEPDSSYSVFITPTDAETPEHYVRIGEISSVKQL